MSDTTLEIPTVESGDAVPTFGGTEPIRFLPPMVNRFDHPLIAQQVRDFVIPAMDWARTSRIPLEEEWRSILRMEMLVHDSGRRYVGRADNYIPLWARANQSLVSNLSQGLFPSDDYFSVRDRESDDQELAQKVKGYMGWELGPAVAGLRRKIKPFLKQLNGFGNSPLKYWYSMPVKGDQNKKSFVHARDAGVSGSFARLPNVDGLRVSPRSMLFFYIWPTTAEGLHDATLVFEDITVPHGWVEDMLRSGQFGNSQAALDSTVPVNFLTNIQDQHTSVYGLTNPTVSPVGNNPLGGVKVISEVWTFLRFPEEDYLPDEDSNEPVPARLVMKGGAVLRCTRNPHFHQKPPYLFTNTNSQPGLVYGYGNGRLAMSLQYLANDFMNQTSDAATYALNPIVLMNMGLLSKPPKPLSPGVMWSVLDVNNAVKFEHPPPELAEFGLQHFTAVSALFKDIAGAPDVMQGTGATRGARTATGAQILQRNIAGPIQDTVEDIELSVLVPLLYGAWLNAQQYRSDEVFVKVAGQSIRIAPEDLRINAEFEWLASSQAMNRAQRASQGIQLLQTVMPLAQYLNQLGYVVNPMPLIQRLYSDSMGFRDFQSFIQKAQGQPMGGQPMPGQQPQPGVQQEQGDRIRSALEQIANLSPGDVEMAPGEGEDFMDVRHQADQMAGQMGGQK